MHIHNANVNTPCQCTYTSLMLTHRVNAHTNR